MLNLRISRVLTCTCNIVGNLRMSRTGSSHSQNRPRYIPSSIREKAAYKNGPHRLIFNMRPSQAYQDAVALDGKTNLFPFTTGSKYIGTWKDNKKHGFGTLTLVNGCKYEGEFQEDKRHGKGTYWVRDGREHRKLYAGDWKHDEKDGFGVFYYRDGGKYEGEWRGGCRHGRGLMLYANGDVYEGDWVEGRRCGLGILRTSGGDRYEGSWMDDKKEGPGTYFFVATGKMYEGEWALGIAKCGQLRDTDVELMGPEEGVTEPFTLPPLTLIKPDDVLGDAITDVRQARIRRRSAVSHEDGKEGQGEEEDTGFSSDELVLLRNIFSSHEGGSGAGGSGLVGAEQVQAMLESLGLGVEEAWLLELFEALGVTDLTRLTFSEFVDLTAIVLKSAPVPAASAAGGRLEEEEGPETNDEDEG